MIHSRRWYHKQTRSFPCHPLSGSSDEDSSTMHRLGFGLHHLQHHHSVHNLLKPLQLCTLLDPQLFSLQSRSSVFAHQCRRQHSLQAPDYVHGQIHQYFLAHTCGCCC
nr:hypothetical protein Iba_chr05aCG4350 [Ipomoea batatas]GMC93592.1 hypothetical protein Iba_chr05bCG3850 [Ipomoea batatas]GMC97424.1 hypothetical protein Iba_chr05dCG6870 [Ipomoea batatas]GMC99539.1 hypothetical protein Iba_chr05eCG6630 [Ipomoea batatas]GMD01271.1 hypothetical protein Iba_chr05fCG5830 [Ipomoea batatas]